MCIQFTQVGFLRNYFNPQRKDERMKSSFPKGQKYLSSEKECATSSICSVSNSTTHSRVIQNNLKNQSVSWKMQVIGACGAKRIPESYRFPRNKQLPWKILNEPKGQLNSEWIYEVIVSPKMPTKNYQDFCPTL